MELPDDLRDLNLSTLVHCLYPEIPWVTKPKSRICRKCGSLDRLPSGACAACKRVQNARRFTRHG